MLSVCVCLVSGTMYCSTAMPEPSACAYQNRNSHMLGPVQWHPFVYQTTRLWVQCIGILQLINIGTAALKAQSNGISVLINVGIATHRAHCNGILLFIKTGSATLWDCDMACLLLRWDQPHSGTVIWHACY